MDRDVMEFYERLRRWVMYNARYLRRPPWDTGISPPELLAFLRDRPAGRAMDLGCGTGMNVQTMAEAGWQVSGVDFAPRAVAQARRRMRIAKKNADLRVGDVTRLDGITHPFDLVLDIGCLHGLTVQGKTAYIQNLPGLLAPGGAFLLYAHWSADGAQSGPGITEENINQIATALTLEHREDSLDSRSRKAVWLTFRKTG